AEFFASAGRHTVKPSVIALCPGDDDPIAGHLMQTLRLFLLRLIPDEQTVWHVANERLAGEMIPASNANRRSQPFRQRGPKHLELPRSEKDKWRDEDDIGVVLPQRLLHFRHGRQRTLDET